MENEKVTRLPVTPGPRPIGAIVQNVVCAALRAKQQREALMKAHAAAARFHEAIAEALEAQDEMEGESPDPYWAEKFTKELGRAATALKDMPITWQAVLQAELPTSPEAA